MDQTTIELLLALIAGGLIIPVIDQIKKTRIVEFIKAEFLTAAALILATWAFVAISGISMTAEQIIQIGLSAAGSAGLVYGGKKLIVGKPPTK